MKAPGTMNLHIDAPKPMHMLCGANVWRRFSNYASVAIL